MKGKIVIEQGPVPDGLPEDAAVISLNIYGDAKLSKFERIAVMHNLASVLSYGPEDWKELLAMARHEPPYDGMVEKNYQIGGTWEEDDGEDD